VNNSMLGIQKSDEKLERDRMKLIDVQILISRYCKIIYLLLYRIDPILMRVKTGTYHFLLYTTHYGNGEICSVM
jgi:hypothetical protein